MPAPFKLARVFMLLLLLGSLARSAEARVVKSSISGSTLTIVLDDQVLTLSGEGEWIKQDATSFLNFAPNNDRVVVTISKLPTPWSKHLAKVTIQAALGEIERSARAHGFKLDEQPTYSQRRGPAGLDIHSAVATLSGSGKTATHDFSLIPVSSKEMVCVIGIGSSGVKPMARRIADGLSRAPRGSGSLPSASSAANLTAEQQAELAGRAIGSLACCVGLPTLAVVGLYFAFKPRARTPRRRSRGRSKAGKPRSKSRSRAKARRVSVDVVEDEEPEDEDSGEDDQDDEEDEDGDADSGDDDRPGPPASGPPRRKYRAKSVPDPEADEPKKTKLKPVRPTRRRRRR